MHTHTVWHTLGVCCLSKEADNRRYFPLFKDVSDCQSKMTNSSITSYNNASVTYWLQRAAEMSRWSRSRWRRRPGTRSSPTLRRWTASVLTNSGTPASSLRQFCPSPGHHHHHHHHHHTTPWWCQLEGGGPGRWMEWPVRNRCTRWTVVEGAQTRRLWKLPPAEWPQQPRRVPLSTWVRLQSQQSQDVNSCCDETKNGS